MKSFVPDLIYPEQAKKRVKEITSLIKNTNNLKNFKTLHRVTIFLTYKCNLSCIYCKTIPQSKEELVFRPQKNETYNYNDFVIYLNSLKEYKIKHLHFTGGEAMLIKDISKMIMYAKKFGVDFVSTTSNGTLNKDYYYNAVKNGIDEIRISLDINDRDIYDSISQRKNQYNKILENIKFLSELRKEFKKFFLIINTVIGKKNYNKLDDFIKFILKFQPNDIKLITEVDEKDFLVSLENKEELIKNLNEIINNYDIKTFPLLRRKINTVFTKESIGLEEVFYKDKKKMALLHSTYRKNC